MRTNSRQDDSLQQKNEKIIPETGKFQGFAYKMLILLILEL